MERKHFLAAAGAVISGATPYPSPSASPYLRRRGEHGSLSDLEHANRVLTHVIRRLQRDQADYGGHRVAAISELERAQAEIVAAIQYDQAHPNSSTINPTSSH